ncbi:chemotaxis protein CheB [Stenomitos frigidus]|uniref:protein-glutamate methylesterase n=1 Tax=Stenomitos frigidus ULC18 TaxID=2107698 RepID=A0A2T1E7B6_9CYAN|nr:chemotaxis protein CheB [Stenomitos frigidus]PSB28627.1 chemotaxis protein CheB [Stenomitos frigidus ULC18]
MNAPADGTNTRPRPFANAAFDLVAVAASAGGLRALSEVLSGLPIDFPAATMVVQHLDPNHRSLMVEILNRRTVLPVQQAHAGDRLRPGVIYIAPPNYHALVKLDGTLALTQSARTNFVRPSADRLFESVAASYGKRAIAVVLTGTGKDGAMGIQAIKQQGGLVIAQDKATAEYFGMPEAAIQTGMVDFVLLLTDIATKLIALVESKS